MDIKLKELRKTIDLKASRLGVDTSKMCWLNLTNLHILLTTELKEFDKISEEINKK